ncbi:hypothetical protein ACMFMF_002100 [Clarireedia jacksonii]
MFVQAPKPNGGMLFENIYADSFGSVGEEVVVRLKWGGQTEYIGKLVSIDSYMNIQLAGAEEWIDGEMTSTLGQVLIRYAIFLWNLGLTLVICSFKKRAISFAVKIQLANMMSIDVTTFFTYQRRRKRMARIQRCRGECCKIRKRRGLMDPSREAQLY